MLHVNIIMVHVNILIMLHVDLIYLAWTGQRYATICMHKLLLQVAIKSCQHATYLLLWQHARYVHIEDKLSIPTCNLFIVLNIFFRTARGYFTSPLLNRSTCSRLDCDSFFFLLSEILPCLITNIKVWQRANNLTRNLDIETWASL